MPESTAAQDRLRDLRYCLDVLRPEAERLEVEQWDCIGIPWHFRRWWRAHRAHKAINARWRAILEGQDHAPARVSSAAMTEREARLIAGTYTGSDVEALRESLREAEERARESQEFIAHTLDYYGERLPSQWRAHARTVLDDA